MQNSCLTDRRGRQTCRLAPRFVRRERSQSHDRNSTTGVATFTAAPVFTNASGTRTALGLGTAATTASTAYDASGAPTAAVAAIPNASTSVTGLLTSANWNTFNSKQAALTPAALTEATSSVLTITGGASALLAATSIQVKLATSTVNGYLAATDWVTFNAKQAALGYTPSIRRTTSATWRWWRQREPTSDSARQPRQHPVLTMPQVRPRQHRRRLLRQAANGPATCRMSQTRRRL
jgi:hypothetical protein